MKKIIYLTFFVFLNFLANSAFADELDFYSKIDDAGDSLVKNLTSRQLQDYSSFKNFAKNCRTDKFAWLDNAPMNEKILQEIENGDFSELMALAGENQKSISSDEWAKMTTCLKSAYQKIKTSSQSEANLIEDIGSTGIFMDGDLSNSDFDIIADIEKINAILFASEFKYEGQKNSNSKSLANYLSGFKPLGLGASSSKNSENSTNSNSNSGQNSLNNSTNSGDNSNSSNQNNFSNNSNSSNQVLPWMNEFCATENHNSDSNSANNSTKVSGVENMIDENFLRDLNSALNGLNTANNGIDYSQNSFDSSKNSQKNNNSNSDFSASNSLNSSDDFETKLPCNSVFCIKIGSNIKNNNLLAGGKKTDSIEYILEKHIEKMNPVSWSSLAPQKMTNNTYQLPFLNIKFPNQIAGGATFTHNTPQTTKITKPNEKTTEMNFDELQKCAWLEAGLSDEFEKNNGVIGAGFDFNSAHDSETYSNATKPLSPTDIAKIADCNTAVQNSVDQKYFQGFSTQTNELQAFTAAMLDIIEQILDNEARLDNVKVQ